MKDIEKYTNSYKFYITVSIAILCMITTLISVGFGALNQNLSIAGDVEYEKDMGNMIKAWEYESEEDFHNSNYKFNIRTIDFLDNKNIPADAVQTWDVSVNSGTSKVMAWIINDPTTPGYYKLYIGANGDVVGNPDSSNMFNNFCNTEEFNFNNNFDTSKVTNMSGMFGLVLANEDFDLSSFDTSNVTDMSYMFSTCDDVAFMGSGVLDLSNFNTSKVTNMAGMFSGVMFVDEIIIDNFDTSKVTNMASMFSNCRKIQTLDLSSFDTSKVTNMSTMFAECYNLTNLNITHFNTSQVTDMSNMFNGLKININLSNFDTSKVTNMRWMFGFYGKEELDLRSFDTSKVTDMSNMFDSSSAITKIRISTKWNISSVTSSNNMFYKCNNLPNFSSSYITKTKAIPTYSGGYLTLDMEGKYFSITPDSNSYTISNSTTGYSSNQTINPSELTKWRVINSNNIGNLQLVSDTVSSTKIYFSGVTGYANLVSGLQTIASQYAKSGTTSSVRCMGYDGQTGTISPTTAFNGSTNSPPSTTTTPTITTGNGEEYGSGVRGDTLYIKDYLLVKEVYGNLKATTVGTSTEEAYWLASRRYDYYSNTNFGFFGRNISASGELESFNRLRHYFDGWIDTNSSFAIRPIMTLNNNLTITGGDGSKDNPYTLS